MKARHIAWIAAAILLCTHLAPPLCAVDFASPMDRANIIGGNIVSSNAGPNPFNGVVVNLLVGAQAFYWNGFWGDDAIIANVESGYIWNGHETLAHVQTYIKDTVNPGPQTGEFDLHATLVGQLLGGRFAFPFIGDYQVGMAPNAELWSAAVATHWIGEPFSFSFDLNKETFINPYKTVMVTGVGAAHRTADVINSSFGDSGDPTGANGEFFSRGVDALLTIAPKIAVFAAGNSGPNGNTVGAPASGFNVIAVGALDIDTGANPYTHLADYSSRGPNDVFVPLVQNVNDISNPLQGHVVHGVRAEVDIVAPGDNMTLAFYGGKTGGNSPTLGTPLDLPVGENYYLPDVGGTSFSSPIVAGGAALMVDAARFLLGNNTKALDGRVAKAILLNSADKNIPGWSNGQVLVSNVITTIQSLDYNSGAGRLNLDRAYNQLLLGNTDLPGLTGGVIQRLGWDFGQTSENSPTDYYFSGQLTKGMQLTVTLNWFVDRGIDLLTDNTVEKTFDDLDLQVWRTAGGVPFQLIAESISQYNNTEHLYFALPDDGNYMLRVLWAGENWDLVNAPNSVQYGLAWAVPEPSGLVLLIVALPVLCWVLVGRARRTCGVADNTTIRPTV